MSDLRDNPYSSPIPANARDSANSGLIHPVYWRAFSIACVVIGLIPIYGHFAHVARDGQLTVLMLMLAWVMTCCNIVICLARGLLLRGSGKKLFLFWMMLSALLAVFAYYGFHGIGYAILELWA